MREHPEEVWDLRPLSGRRYYPEPPGFAGPQTSPQELVDLTLAVLVLTAIFAMPPGGVFVMAGLPAWLIAALFGVAALAVLLSVVTHELAHKFVAQRYGCWAEFRRSDFWLLIGLFVAATGFAVVAPPGAVMIAGPVTNSSNGKISAAGPVSNAVMGFALLPLALFVPAGSIAEYILLQVILVNGMLGIFNMLPVHPLDGSKVVSWSVGAYIAVVGALVSLLALVQWRFNFLGL